MRALCCMGPGTGGCAVTTDRPVATGPLMIQPWDMVHPSKASDPPLLALYIDCTTCGERIEVAGRDQALGAFALGVRFCEHVMARHR